MTSHVGTLFEDRRGRWRPAVAVLMTVVARAVARPLAWLAALSQARPYPDRGRHDGW